MYSNGLHPSRSKGINRRNPLTKYWMKEEIWLHDLKSVFPDWGVLAVRYMENKRRDRKEKYSRRRSKEIIYKKHYRQRPEVKIAAAKRMREKRKCSIEKIRKNLGKRLWEILKGQNLTKGHSILRYIGCNQNDLRIHLERQFTAKMTWKNYGKYWHVDHIIPCAAFDHADEKQIAVCWHFTNLRPLAAKENSAKSGKITLPQMALRI